MKYRPVTHLGMKPLVCAVLLLGLFLQPVHSDESVPQTPEKIETPYLLEDSQAAPTSADYAVVLSDTGGSEFYIQELQVEVGGDFPAVTNLKTPKRVEAGSYVVLLLPKYPKSLLFEVSRDNSGTVDVVIDTLVFRQALLRNPRCSYTNDADRDNAWSNVRQAYGLPTSVKNKTIVLQIGPEILNEPTPASEKGIIEHANHLWLPLCPLPVKSSSP